MIIHDNVICGDGSVEGAGSFIKPSAKMQWGCTFMQALKEKYVMVSSEELMDRNDLTFGDTAYKVETKGFEKVFKKQSQLQNLVEVGLPLLNIAEAGDTEEIRHHVPNIMDLDLSRNLISCWKTVASICVALERLESLRLGSNRFAPLKEPLKISAFPQLKALSLDKSLIPWKEVALLELQLPVLESLHLNHNGLKAFYDGQNALVHGFRNLKWLNLESNAIQSWDEVHRFSELPRYILLDYIWCS